MTASVQAAYFDALYATDPDPWHFATSPYERDKYAASLAALPNPHDHAALEVGCSIGILTNLLARRCDTVLALDVAESALHQARRNCPAPNVRFERRQIPAEWPQGRFDLIVFSEILYYLNQQDLDRTANHAKTALNPNGTILLVHYLGETDAPQTGNTAAESFIATTRLPLTRTTKTPHFRIDVLNAPPTDAEYIP